MEKGFYWIQFPGLKPWLCFEQFMCTQLIAEQTQGLVAMKHNLLPTAQHNADFCNAILF